MNVIYFFVFLFGAIIGSFLNCLMYRLEKEESIMGRSYCPHCRHTLAWYDLVPILSFLWLRGQCRYCHKKVSPQYPFIEALTGFSFLLSYVYFAGYDWSYLIWIWYIASSLIVIFVYDIKFFLIPDKVLFPAILVSLFYGLSLNHLLAAVLASGFFLALYLVSRGTWMGFGDVKLAILLGFLLGFPNILVGLFLAFLLGSVVGVTLMVVPFFQKKTHLGFGSQLPFAPFLIAGTVIAFFFGSQLIAFYQSFFIF